MTESNQPPKAKPLRAALGYPDFRRLITSMGLSSGGDWLYNVALVTFVYEQTGSAGWVAATTVTRLAPYVLFSAIGGVIAERHDARAVGSSRVDLQACKLEYSIVSPK